MAYEDFFSALGPLAPVAGGIAGVGEQVFGFEADIARKLARLVSRYETETDPEQAPFASDVIRGGLSMAVRGGEKLIEGAAPVIRTIGEDPVSSAISLGTNDLAEFSRLVRSRKRKPQPSPDRSVVSEAAATGVPGIPPEAQKILDSVAKPEELDLGDEETLRKIISGKLTVGPNSVVKSGAGRRGVSKPQLKQDTGEISEGGERIFKSRDPYPKQQTPDMVKAYLTSATQKYTADRKFDATLGKEMMSIMADPMKGKDMTPEKLAGFVTMIKDSLKGGGVRPEGPRPQPQAQAPAAEESHGMLDDAAGTLANHPFLTLAGLLGTGVVAKKFGVSPKMLMGLLKKAGVKGVEEIAEGGQKALPAGARRLGIEMNPTIRGGNPSSFPSTASSINLGTTRAALPAPSGSISTQVLPRGAGVIEGGNERLANLVRENLLRDNPGIDLSDVARNPNRYRDMVAKLLEKMDAERGFSVK